MKKLVLPGLLSAAVLTTSGCSWVGLDDEFRDKGEDYKVATTIEPLTLPQGYDSQKIGELYPVPVVPAQVELVDEDGEFLVPAPTPLDFKNDVQNVKIQRLGDDRWVKINVAAEEVWPRLRGWLNSQNVVSALAKPDEGLIQTEWLEFNDNSEERRRFQIYVSSGYKPSETEIRVAEQAAPALSLESITEFSASAKPQREDWLIDSMAKALASQVDEETVSLLAQNIGSGAKADLVISDDVPHLDLKVGLNRAWTTLSTGISNIHLTVVQANKDKLRVTIDYHPQTDIGEDEGWFFGMFSSEEEQVVKSYDLHAYSVENVIRVEVKEADKPVDAAVARQVLSSVYEALN